ncbi:hypothetical protein Droror1_Dr00008751 [Drosera rotundifolia]
MNNNNIIPSGAGAGHLHHGFPHSTSSIDQGFHHHHHHQQQQQGFLDELPNPNPNPKPNTTNPLSKKRRNLPGTPDPDAEVIALSPKTLMATNRFVCEICNKGFQRDQNLQLHRRGHNLPWKLKQRTNKDLPVKKKVYICPEKTCVHHEPSRALGDLTGIKKHFSRKHGEKKWKCEKCSKKYAVQSDWKAHSKTCGTREYKCDCGTLFSRKDSFITHRAFCDALAEESARLSTVAPPPGGMSFKGVMSGPGHQAGGFSQGFVGGQGMADPAGITSFNQIFRPDLNGIVAGNLINSGLPDMMQMASANLYGSSTMPNLMAMNQFQLMDHHRLSSNSTGQTSHSLAPLSFGMLKEEDVEASSSSTKANILETLGSLYSSDHHHHLNQGNNQQYSPPAPMSATALLQKAAQLGSTRSSNPSIFGNSFGVMASSSSSNRNIATQNNVAQSELHQVVAQTPKLESLQLPNPGMIGSDGRMGGMNVSLPMVATSVTELDQLMTTNTMNSNVKLQKDQDNRVRSRHVPQGLKQAGDGGMTRDFLGMGGEQGGRPFSQLELANFASMSSAMGLNHFPSK